MSAVTIDATDLRKSTLRIALRPWTWVIWKARTPSARKAVRARLPRKHLARLGALIKMGHPSSLTLGVLVGGTALAVWWALVSRRRRRKRLGTGTLVVRTRPVWELLTTRGKSDMESACELWATVFSKPGRTPATVRAERRAELESDKRTWWLDERWHLVCRREGDGTPDRVVAAARTFLRPVRAGEGEERFVLGLAHVACHPDVRKQGLGKMVFEAAMRRVHDCDEVDAALFQTAVPEFYNKLGAAVLTDRAVVNSTGLGSDAKRKKGFWDPSVCLYPREAASAWPAGDIDLLGPGY